jgi:hypothetical protein
MRGSKKVFFVLLTISMFFLFAADSMAAKPGFDDKEIRIAQLR